MPACCSATPAPLANGAASDAGACAAHMPVLSLAKFMLEPDEVAALQQQHGLSLEVLMRALLAPAALLARAPISAFPVGSVGLGASGRLYVGANLEFPGLPLFHSVHSEQFLVANAAWHGETALRRITLNAAPCGHCRQFLSELVDAEAVDLEYKGHVWRLDAILVDKFCPGDLITPGSAPLLLQPQAHKLNLGKAALAACQGNAELQEAAQEALAAAQRSYAPYTGCPAGLALRARSGGGVYGGSLIESCAYNPTLNPLQAACIVWVAQGQGDFSEIGEAVLVELPGSAVQHEDTTGMALRAISPDASLTVLHLERA